MDNKFPPIYIKGFHDKLKQQYENKNIYIWKSFFSKADQIKFVDDLENNKEIVQLKCQSVEVVTTKYGIDLCLHTVGVNSENASYIPSFQFPSAIIPQSKIDSIRDAYKLKIEKENKKRIEQEIEEKKKIEKMIHEYIYENDGSKRVWYYISRESSQLERFESYKIAKIVPKDTKKWYIIEFENTKNSNKHIINTYLNENHQLSFLDNKCSKENFKKKYPKVRHWNAIKEHSVKIGMLKIEVELSWGKPNKKNISEGIWGIHEQWVYDNEYIYIENGKVTAIQYF